MKEMILLTKEEYQNLMGTIEVQKERSEEADELVTWLHVDLQAAHDRVENLWNALNRPAIEAAAQAHEDEFLDWCADKAEEYEKLEFDAWTTNRAQFYNNGRNRFCKMHGIDEKDYELYARYDEWHPVVTEEKTEGWSDIKYYKYGKSFILSKAMDDIYERYEANKAKTGAAEGKYWKLWYSFIEMRDESTKVIGDNFGDFYR